MGCGVLRVLGGLVYRGQRGGEPIHLCVPADALPSPMSLLAGRHTYLRVRCEGSSRLIKGPPG